VDPSAQPDWLIALGQAFVASITALHGRGFFPGSGDTAWQMAVAALDAVAGLLLEAGLIATFTQRFVDK
jgi:hypothetical protein